jgi:C4-dicarboxylate transporter DctM subunit
MAVGSVAAGGALGILIPPSITMIIFSSITGVSVGKLFIAGIIPGILLTLLYILYIAHQVHNQSQPGPGLGA